MKLKYSFLTLAIAASLTLVACGGGGDSEPEPNPTNPTTPTDPNNPTTPTNPKEPTVSCKKFDGDIANLWSAPAGTVSCDGKSVSLGYDGACRVPATSEVPAHTITCPKIR